jgi:2-polyprenyl-6-methoxyphenol hydroxylase-like FAD-dependent oxidoreductase
MIGASTRPYEEHSMEFSVCVVGGGIGGLTAALSLLRRGFDVQVYEQAAALGEVGAGVQVSPNASRVLHRLGLAEELATTGVKPVAWHQRRWDDGRTLLRSPLAEPLEATDETFIWALFDHVPLGRWSAGRVTLLGDACHAMLPFFAQGAAQAIEDGAALAACLGDTGPDPAAALRRYETVRLPRATRLQAMSTANKTRFHLPDGPEQQGRDAEMAAGSTDWSFDAVAWLYNHDATVVNPMPDLAATQPKPASSPGS